MANHMLASAQKTLLCFIAAWSITIGQSAVAQVRVGEMAPEIELLDTKDLPVTLSSLKGKVVLVDFWASWCAPCRESNPSVVKLYAKYKSLGFEVFGVSIDSKKANWLKAIKQDRITYIQVNDPLGWKSLVAERWGIDQIPTTFLVDKSGKVRAIDAEGANLDRFVRKLLDESR